MHQASVGFQCPECVKKGSTRVVRGAAALGAGFRPVATQVLIALNAFVWLLGEVLGGGSALAGSNVLDVRGGLIANGYQMTIGGHSHFVGVAHGEWWRVVTAGFLHYGLIHLAMNMWALYILGSLTERVLGRARFLAVYFVALLAGSFGALVVTPGALTVGASGAIFGLLGALLVVARSRGVRLADTGLVGVLVLNLVITFGIPGISIGGHLGGLVGGAAATAAVVMLPPLVRGARGLAHDAGALIVCVGLAAALVVGSVVVARTHSTPAVICVNSRGELLSGPGCAS